MTTPASGSAAELELTMDELREVTRYVVACAAHVVGVFARVRPDDPRVGAALDAAQAFAGGGPRNRRLRTAGDAAASAYLHPTARAHQVGHILRAAACAARIAELTAVDDPTAAARSIEDATARATPVVLAVLRRYPAPPAGRNRIEQLTSDLDTMLRAHR